MIDLKSLEEAMTDISGVGHHEHEFEVNEKRYVLWPLTADQEREVFEYAETAIEGTPSDEQGQAESISYMDRFRIAAISHSLVVIDTLDLRNQEEIETGALIHGKPEFISRYQALRRFVSNWTKPLIDQVFLQFGEMNRRVEEKARKAVRYTPSDLSSEIDHMQERLMWIEDQLQRHENPDPDLSTKVREQITAITDIHTRQRALLTGGSTEREVEDHAAVRAQAHQEPPEPEPEPEPPPAPEPPPQRPRAPQAFTAADRPIPAPRPEHPLEPLKPVSRDMSRESVRRPLAPPPSQSPRTVPQDAPPDPRFRAVAPPTSRQDRPPAPEAEAEEEPQTPTDYEERFHAENPDIERGADLMRYTPSGDSLMGDNEAASVEEEGRRQALLRRQRIQREMEEQRAREESFHETTQSPSPPQPGGVGAPGRVQMTPGGVMVAPGQSIPGGQQRRAPVPAPHREAASVQSAVDQAHAASGARPAGDIRGIPAYELPRQELSPRTKRESAQHRAGKVVVDSPGAGEESVNPRFAGRRRQR